MTHDVERHKGIVINIEIAGEHFIPAIHDPMRHKPDAFARLPDCAADTYQEAMRKAQEWIDRACVGEVEDFAKKAKLKLR